MKKITAIIAVLAIATVIALTGCQKQEAPKPAEHSEMTSTATTTMPMASPETK